MPLTRPTVMGVVNVTPDSFSDGGSFVDPLFAVEHALELVGHGAGILDIGGESTRPGAEPVSEAEELERVLPVIHGVRKRWHGPISIDTRHPAVARAAFAAGAKTWNDISALSAPGAIETAADLGCDVVLMHMQGDPRTMQDAPRYKDVVHEVADYLADRAGEAMGKGVHRARISVDPGIGFGKTLEHNLALLHHLDRIVRLGFPVVLGASRKRSIEAIDETATDPGDRIGGSLAMALWGTAKGASVIRAHDVRETVQALKVWAAVAAHDTRARLSPA